MTNLAIYSIYCGHSDNKTLAHAMVDARYPHVFISNNREILEEAASIGWNPVFSDLAISEDPVISAAQSKIAKANPRVIGELLDFDYLCYKDDKRHLNMDGLEDCVAFVEATCSSIGMRPHPFLADNILFEFGESLGQARYKSQWAQMAAYIADEAENGYKIRSQLYWTGAILRNMRHRDTETIDLRQRRLASASARRQSCRLKQRLRARSPP